MRIKTCAAHIKAAGTHEGTVEGEFQALVATYDLDSVGDKIVPGAFADTLAEWAASGDPIPVYWSHRMDDPAMNIGQVLDAQETAQGLEVKAQLDLDNPTATQVYKLLKGRRVTQFSFAYDIDEGAFVEQKDEPSYYELRKLKLYEVGPTPIGANQETDLLDIKAVSRALGKRGALIGSVLEQLGVPDWDDAEPKHHTHVRAKEGRRNSADDMARIQVIHNAALQLGATCGTDGTGDGLGGDGTSDPLADAEKATPTVPAATEKPDGAKVDAPAPIGPASIRLRTELGLVEAGLLP